MRWNVIWGFTLYYINQFYTFYQLQNIHAITTRASHRHVACSKNMYASFVFFLARPKFISQLFLTQAHVLPFFSFSIWGLYCCIVTGMLLCELQHSYEPLILSKGTTPIEEQNTKLSGTLLIGRWIWLVPSQIKPNRDKKAVLLVNFFRLCTCFLIHYPLTLKETIMDSVLTITWFRAPWAELQNLISSLPGIKILKKLKKLAHK